MYIATTTLVHFFNIYCLTTMGYRQSIHLIAFHDRYILWRYWNFCKCVLHFLSVFVCKCLLIAIIVARMHCQSTRVGCVVLRLVESMSLLLVYRLRLPDHYTKLVQIHALSLPTHGPSKYEYTAFVHYGGCIETNWGVIEAMFQE